MIINILNQDILPIPKSYSEDIKNLVFLLLKKDPNLRPSIDEIFLLDCVKEKIKFFQNKNLLVNKELVNPNPNPNTNPNTNTNISNVSISPININAMNSNLNFTNFSQISQNHTHNTVNQYSPINENDSSLFNFGYGNLLKQIVEVDNENSVSNSPRTIDNKIRVNTIKKQEGGYTNSANISNTQTNINSTNPNANANANANRRHHKYSPSYAMNDMSHIMKSLMQTENDENLIMLKSGEGEGTKNLSKFSKNQISVPEFREKQSMESPIKLTMEESKKKNHINIYTNF